MTQIRTYRNGDSPALADLWNRGLPDRGVVRPLGVHEFDALVLGRLGFEAAGLIVAEREGRLVAFAHAGFGPEEPKGPSHQLDTSMGAVAMFVAEPGLDDPELDRAIFLRAEQYLRRRGASVFYAGGIYPLNPFYWGLYGGSEWAGVLDSHLAFGRAATRAGYQPMSNSVLMETGLDQPETVDARMILARRQYRVEIAEDTLPDGWWEALAIGPFRPTTFDLRDRSDDRTIGRATTWDIAGGFGVGDGRCRTGLISLEVAADRRRRGLARYLVSEVLRHAHAQMSDLVCVQTSAENEAALALYARLGFEQVGTATTYRLPAELMGRSAEG